MTTLGQTFKEAREKKGVTASQAAAATRMKIQTLEALEKDDFKGIAAPMYARGFIKLYAEYLGLDAAPLIREYQDLHAPKTRAPLTAEERSSSDATASERKRIQIDWSRLKKTLNQWKRPLAISAGVLAVLAILVNGIVRYSRRITELPLAPAAVEKKIALPMIREPPEPYMETSATGQKTP